MLLWRRESIFVELTSDMNARLRVHSDLNARSRAEIALAGNLLGNNGGLGSARSARTRLCTARNESASREQFGVEQRCSSRAAHEIVREQRQLDVEQRAFAHASDDSGHTIARVYIALRLR